MCPYGFYLDCLQDILYILFIHFLSTMMSTALIGQILPHHDETKLQEPLIKTNASVLSSFLLVFCQSDEKKLLMHPSTLVKVAGISINSYAKS